MKLKPEVEELISHVQKPLSYIANEENAIIKERPSLRFCLIYPDLYELGISSLGINILYGVLNREKDIWAQRAYMPAEDMRRKLKESNMPLFSLEEMRPLNEFDILGFSLPHELCYTNILHILNLSNLPLRSKSRGNNHPLVIAGGCGAYNPLPLSPFIDAFVIGDGEEVILEIARKVKKQKLETLTNQKINQLRVLSKIKGVWVPPNDGQSPINYQPVEKCLVKDLNKVKYEPLIPAFKGENRLVVELMRGCSRGCRFCQAGFVYRPIREKEAEVALEEGISKIDKYGLEELSLLSLSTSDYSEIEYLSGKLSASLKRKNVRISLPSLRTDKISLDILRNIASVKKTHLTFAIEAGSQRLRDLINKNLNEEEILKTLEGVFASGWQKVKLYFMIGLPTETENDLKELVELVYKIRNMARKNLQPHLRDRLKITVSIANYVPKPHTPFQWVAQDNLQILQKKQNVLINAIKGPSFVLKWHDAKQSIIEGLFARGDEKTAEVLEKAYFNGAIFDNFSEHFNFSAWEEAINQAKIKLEEYQKARSLKEDLAWDFVKVGVKREFLENEYRKGLAGVLTKDCRHKCVKCGLCGKDVKNRISKQYQEETKRVVFHPSNKVKYRLNLRRESSYKYLSHLDWISLIERKLRQTNYDFVYKGRYSSRMKLSFSQALPVGFSSNCEYVDFSIYNSPGFKDIKQKLQNIFKRGVVFADLKENPSKNNLKEACYQLKIANHNGSINHIDLEKIICGLQERRQEFIKIPKKEGFLSVKLKECILRIDNTDCVSGKYNLYISCPFNVRPDKLLKALAKMCGFEIKILSVLKTSLK